MVVFRFGGCQPNQSCPSDALKTMWIQQTASSNGSKNKREDVAEAAVHGE